MQRGGRGRGGRGHHSPHYHHYGHPIMPLPLPVIVPVPIMPLPVIVPAPIMPLPVPIPDLGRDINLRPLTGDLYIVTTDYLRNNIFRRDPSGSFSVVGYSSLGTIESIRYYTNDEISRMPVRIV